MRFIGNYNFHPDQQKWRRFPISDQSALHSNRNIEASPLLLMGESPDFEQVTVSCGIPRRKHFSLHLPGSLNPLPCKIQRTPTILRIEMIEYFHELFTVLPWRVVVEEVELRYALAVEISQHYSCFLVAMPVSPDCIEAFYRRGDNVPAILGRCKQLY